MSARTLLRHLRSLSNTANVQGMRRFGIQGDKMLGIPIPVLRAIAKQTGRNHELAAALWKSGLHEARILAAYIDDPRRVTKKQMDSWVRDFDSWDVCDQVCGNLFDRTPYGFTKAKEWIKYRQEYVRRAGFVMMAALAVHDKTTDDAMFAAFLPAIEYYAFDERNFVKKAVNWALRQIGKRNASLRTKAVACARRIHRQDAASARWIASDALRELQRPAVIRMVRRRSVLGQAPL